MSSQLRSRTVDKNLPLRSHWHTLPILNCHAIRVGMVGVGTKVIGNAVHDHPADALGLRDGAILVCEEERLQIHDLFAQLRHLSG